MSALVLAHGLVAQVGPATGQTPPAARSTKTYDIGFLIAAEDVLLPARMGTPVGEASERRAGGVAEERESAVSAEWFLTLIKDALGVTFSDEPEGPRLDWDEGGTLVATCDGKAHAQLATLIEECRRFFLEQVTLEVHVLPASVLGAGAGVLRKDEAERVLAAAGPHGVFSTPARLGGRQALQSNSMQAYVKDYEVEVAQASQISDPKVDALILGNGWSLRTVRAHDGRVILRVQGDQAERHAATVDRELRGLDVKEPGKVTLVQLPRTAVLQQDTQVVLGDGEAVLLGCGGDLGMAWCVRVRRPRPAAPPAVAGWWMAPVGDVVGAAMPARQYGIARLTIPGEESAVVIDAQGDARSRVLSSDLLIAHVRDCIGADASRSVQEVGDLLLVRAPAEELTAARDRVAVLADGATRQVGVEVRYGTIETSDVAGVVHERTEIGELAGRLKTTCVTASLLGDDFGMRAGKQFSYVHDYEVEIAQDSAISNPVIDVLFAGVALNGRVLPVPGGQYRFQLHFAFSALDGDISTFDPKNERIGTIDVPKLRTINFRVSPIVDDNRWTLMYLAPLQGTTQHLAVVARVRG